MQRLCVIILYFGRWPEWFGCFIASCRRNRSIDWLIVTDCGVPQSAPENIRFLEMTWEDCAELVAKECCVSNRPATPYKLCDYKFTFGHVFQKHIADYDFWAFGDVDVIYGDIRSYLSQEMLAKDLITFNKTHVSGHFTILRNTHSIRTRFGDCALWRSGIDSQYYMGLDENLGFYDIDSVYSEESFNTPLSPYIPWISGAFTFPAVWYYVDGRLYNNIDGDKAFLYLHFMRYKLRWIAKNVDRVVHCDSTNPALAWKLCIDGFYPYCEADEVYDRGRVITIPHAQLQLERLRE